jgi:hypothetical protein
MIPNNDPKNIPGQRNPAGSPFLSFMRGVGPSLRSKKPKSNTLTPERIPP